MCFPFDVNYIETTLGHAFCTFRLEGRNLVTGAVHTAKLHYCDIAHPTFRSYHDTMQRSHGGTFVMLKHILAAVRAGTSVPQTLLHNAFAALVAIAEEDGVCHPRPSERHSVDLH